MTHKCSVCGETFEDGEEFGEHMATHEERTLGVMVSDELITDDIFGG